VKIRHWDIWFIAFSLMVLFALLTVYFVRSKNPAGAVISVLSAVFSIYLGMRLAGIERNEEEKIREMKVLTLTIEIYAPIIAAFSVWKLASSYGTENFELLNRYFFIAVQLLIYSYLTAMLYHWLRK